MTTLAFAITGSTALWLLYLWLLSAIAAAELSRSKGYGEKLGLGTGMLLSALGLLIWFFIPPRDETAEWNGRKPWQRRQSKKQQKERSAELTTTALTRDS